MTKLTVQKIEKADGDILNFDVKELKKLPLRIAMKTLELIEAGYRGTNRFLEFDQHTQSFIDDNQDKYSGEEIVEGKKFKKVKQFYLNSVSGPLYQDPNKVLDIVTKVYGLEKFLDNGELPKIPKIVYTVKDEGNSLQGLVIKDIEKLIEKFGQAKVLHTAVLFKDHLNKDHQLVMKTSDKPYILSQSIVRAAFNEDKNDHEYLPAFDGKDYELGTLLDQQCAFLSKPEDILLMIVLREEFRENMANTSSKKNKM